MDQRTGSRVVALVLTCLFLGLHSSSASATLIGDQVGACGLIFSDCVSNPAPGLSSSGTLAPASGLANVGPGIEFTFTSASGNTTHTADFGADSLRLEVGANVGGSISFNGFTDLGWVFTDIDDSMGAITNVTIDPGGTLPIATLTFGPNRIDINYSEFFTVSQCCSVFSEFTITTTAIPEPTAMLLFASGLAGLALRLRSGSVALRRTA